MSLPELVLVVLGGGVLGYVVVAFLMSGGRAKQGGRSPTASSPVASLTESTPAWPDVLGVSRSASDDDVRLAYRRQMSDYHPDKVASLGREL